MIDGEGQMEWLNGDIYSGSFQDNFCHGKGIFQWKNGNKYDGNWFMGMQHGKGCLILSQDKITYGFW